jgi:hypothetical protein
MVPFTQKSTKMITKISVTQYCEKYAINRHAVHRRITKFESTGLSVNNIVQVERVGPKIIILSIDTKIRFKKK